MELHKVYRKISIGVKKIIDLNTEFLAKTKIRVRRNYSNRRTSRHAGI
jgi:hypothetical protein